MTKRFWINRKTFSQYKTPIQIRLNTAEEWRVTADSENHPFHIHVNPFQVVRYTDVNGNSSTPANVWRDTLYIRQGETYTIRTRLLSGGHLPKASITFYYLPKPSEHLLYTYRNGGGVVDGWKVSGGDEEKVIDMSNNSY